MVVEAPETDGGGGKQDKEFREWGAQPGNRSCAALWSAIHGLRSYHTRRILPGKTAAQASRRSSGVWRKTATDPINVSAAVSTSARLRLVASASAPTARLPKGVKPKKVSE
jgi:hypothetical protein